MTNTPPRPEINPAIGALLQSARDFLTHEHTLFSTLGLKPLLIGRGQMRFSFDTPASYDDGDGNVHGGFLTIVNDSIMGLTVFTTLEEFKPIATVNLRTDYIEPLKCGTRAVCTCDCYAIVDEIAFVKAEIRTENDSTLIATGSAAFMVGTRGPSKVSRL